MPPAVIIVKRFFTDPLTAYFLVHTNVLTGCIIAENWRMIFFI